MIIVGDSFSIGFIRCKLFGFAALLVLSFDFDSHLLAAFDGLEFLFRVLSNLPQVGRSLSFLAIGFLLYVFAFVIFVFIVIFFIVIRSVFFGFFVEIAVDFSFISVIVLVIFCLEFSVEFLNNLKVKNYVYRKF